MVTTLDERRARHAAEQVPDPELPMLTLADLGVLRGIDMTPDGTVVARLTPTYSGCPAMAEMRADVSARLRAAGFPGWRSAPSSTRRGRRTGSPPRAAAS